MAISLTTFMCDFIDGKIDVTDNLFMRCDCKVIRLWNENYA